MCIIQPFWTVLLHAALVSDQHGRSSATVSSCSAYTTVRHCVWDLHCRKDLGNAHWASQSSYISVVAIIVYAASAPWHHHYFFFCCSTQLALQLRQKRSQLVCSNRGAPGPRALPQWTLNLKAYAHSCRQTSKKQNKTHMRKHATCMNNRVPKQQFYISSYLFNFFLTFHDLVLMRWILIVSKNY